MYKTSDKQKEEKQKMKNKFWYFLALGLFVLDLITKYATDGLNIVGTNVFVDIISVHNYGASWGMMAGHGVLFIVLGIIFVIGMFCYDFLVKKDYHENGWFFVGFNLILAGIMGNVYDRIIFGYVRDFISCAFIDFPVFNVADVCLTIGTGSMLVWLLFFCGKPRKNLKGQNNEG